MPGPTEQARRAVFVRMKRRVKMKRNTYSKKLGFVYDIVVVKMLMISLVIRSTNYK